MDTSLTIKPRDGTGRVGSARANIVRTDLAAAQSVAAPVAPEATRHGAAPQDAASRDLVDPQSREVIYRARDERTRKQRRAPDEALSRMRAYRPDAPLEPQSDGGPHADLEI
jgi:hypothetical protein